jgi:signal transduction histidine kinase/CheY-like chemotaxis protein
VDHAGVVDDIAAFLEGRPQSALAAPVRARGRVIGSLTVATPEPGRRYGPLEQEILAALAEHAGLALFEAGAVPDEPEESPAEPEEGPVDGARLRQAQALEAAGSLADRIAGELNHALSVVLGHAAVLGTRPLDPAAQEDLADLVAAAERGVALVHKLGQFGRRDDGEPEVVDAGALLVTIARQAIRAAPAPLEADVSPGASPLPVEVDPGKLRQALSHVLDNALAAGGPLTARAEEVELDGRHAQLTIADGGSGMDADVLSRALEPGFTTRPAGSGAGMGLSVAHRIVHRAGGRLSLRSAPGAGTTVTILLPIADESGPAPQPATPTVIAVHEDPAVLAAIRQVLTAGGAAVFGTRSVDEALTAARREPGAVVLVDDAVVDRFADAVPQAPVVVMSAYADELADGDADAWLQKPFDAAALLAAVRSATNRD